MSAAAAPPEAVRPAAAVDKLSLINGLRGLAIVGVILHHSFFDDFKYQVTGIVGTPFSLVMSSGWLGVNLFFFLSGFVLYLPYASGKRRMASAADASDFYKRRFLRLMPLYWLVWIFSLVFLSGLQVYDRSFYVAGVLYATALFPFHPATFYPAGNWVMWSLGLEIWFSVLFPLVVAAIVRYGWKGVLPVVLAGAFLVRLAGQMFAAAPPGQVLNFVSDSVLGRFDEFVLGMLAAHLYFSRKVISPLWFAPGAIMILTAFLIWDGWYHKLIPGVLTPLAGNVLDSGILLCVLVLLQHRSWLGRLLGNWVLQLLGMMCYSIYLWHGVVQQHFAVSFKGGVIQYLAYLASVMAISFLTYRYVEFSSTRTWRELLPGRQNSGNVPQVLVGNARMEKE